jgi:hypothetical protein
MSWKYHAYGMALCSAFPLPSAARARQNGTAVVLTEALAPLETYPAQTVSDQALPAPTNVYRRISDGADYYRWPGLLELLVSPGGRRITFRGLNGAVDETFRRYPYLLTQALSFALLQQGAEQLHATAVVVDGQAVALLGDSGYGKSTLAAAFLRAGHRLLTDDLLVIKESAAGFTGEPGPSQLKLYPHTARKMLKRRLGSTPMAPHTRKLIIDLPAPSGMGKPVPIRALYLLPRPDGRRIHRIGIRPLFGRRALLAVLSNVFNAVVRDRNRLERQFLWASRLTQAVPIKSLSYPRQLRCLPAVIEAIEQDLQR